jgi:guanylate kinase
VISKRMSRAGDEVSHFAEYDYIVINHDIDEAYAEVLSVLRAERLKRERRSGLTAFVRELQQQLERD